MLRTFVALSAFAAGLSSLDAAAAISSGPAPTAGPAAIADPHAIVLAQNNDLEVYYDGRGNRVIIDPYTGKVIAVQPPNARANRQALRRELRQRDLDRADDQDRYYLDDPEDMARFRRRQLEEMNQGGLSSEGYPGSGADPYDDNYSGDGEVYPEQRRMVTREPLQEPGHYSDDQAALPALPGTSDAIIEPPVTFKGRQEVAALQVLLDRAGASPGVIDGRFGSNVDKALVAYRELTGVNLKSTDAVGIQAALAESGGDAFASYTITPEDAAGPFVASIPSDYSEKARLERMAFTSVPEMLAERFHMDENYLKSINPEANFNRPGTIIKVANFGRLVNKPVARIIADKGQKQVRAYDETGRLVASYPATIGSSDTPSPTGIHAVSRVALDPNYTYNPKINFKQGENDKILTIPPGPNGPVGSVWIALDKPTYGIHGTPDPSKIGKTESHGCVRLTNWDARELAKIVKSGVPVEFIE